MKDTEKEALLIISQALAVKSIQPDSPRRKDFIHELKASPLRIPWKFINSYKLNTGIYDFTEAFKHLGSPSEPPKPKDPITPWKKFPAFEGKKTNKKVDKSENPVEEPIDTEDDTELTVTEETKSYDAIVLEKTPVPEVSPSDIYKEFVFLVESADSTTDTVVVGIAKTFTKAYQVLAERALHAQPSMSEQEARNLIDQNGAVMLKSAQMKYISCVISKQELL